MKRKSAVQLTAMVARGEKITVLYDSAVFQAKALLEARVIRVFRSKNRPWNKLWWRAGRIAGTILRSTSSEGRDWARGWDTDDANALRAAVALDD